MPDVTVTFIGSGDAFGSGGRLQTCILVDGPGVRFAVDFGATSLVGLRQQGVDPNSIDLILLTHLHGDHCGGVPFLLVDAMLGSKRKTALTILGPTGTQAHLRRLHDALFPGSPVMEPRFPLEHLEIRPGEALHSRGLTVTAAAARHTPETNPLAVRIQVGDASIAYTGDGELSDALVQLVSGADLLIAESYFYDKPVKGHLNYPDIARLDAKRIVLTHMHTNMLQQVANVPEACACDGYVLSVRG
jgi:ribonuclease BN (tRNA processing enzyme)